MPTTEPRKLYGPPGTGKTRELTALLCRAAASFGPDRVAGLTYTRAAAAELQERVAQALGQRLPDDPWRRRSALRAWMPWVGTIHSLAYRLIGRCAVVGPRDIAAFVKSRGGQACADFPEPDDIESYAWLEPGKDEVEQALALYSMARHRMQPLERVYQAMPWGPEGPQVTPERAEKLAAEYEDFKRAQNKIDFEDMLEMGASEHLPVDAVLADEVQDNSPLLWKCLDGWAEGALYAMAGDPYQAIYIFSGAEPRLFIDHPGKLISLGDSKRLNAPSADRAQAVLRAAGFADREWLGSWTGVADGLPRDGTAFWLARTGRLLGEVTRSLEDDGIPFGYLRGHGPLEGKAARAYRVLAGLRRSGAAPVSAINALATELKPGWLPHGEKARLAHLARTDPDMSWDEITLERAWGTPISDLHHGLSHGLYFEKIMRRSGIEAFYGRPKTLVGTIHSAKGREADTVHLVESWGSLPYRAIYNGQAEAEACVAYVGLTRHRSQLILEPASEGTPYPF